MSELTDADRDLVSAADSVLREHGAPGEHTTGAAVRTTDGRVYTGVSLKARTGQADVHAEPVAVARARLDGAEGFDAIAAVQFEEGFSGPTRVVSACGSCREVLVARAPGVEVLVRQDGELGKRPIESLLPR